MSGAGQGLEGRSETNRDNRDNIEKHSPALLLHCTRIDTLPQVCSDPKGESDEVEESSAEASQRLQRMKIQSRRTFKFRKTRKREKIGEECEAAGGGGEMEAAPAAKMKASSMTATVLRRARQGRKQKPTVQISVGKESTVARNILIN